MKKLFISFLMISTLLLVSYDKVDRISKTETPRNSITAISVSDDYSNSQNDLIYHDYGTGIKLKSNSSLTIPYVKLNIKDETATIYAMNLSNNELIKICEYHPSQIISYTPDSAGVYKIIAELSNGDLVDLTPQATVQESYSTESSDGFIRIR